MSALVLLLFVGILGLSTAQGAEIILNLDSNVDSSVPEGVINLEGNWTLGNNTLQYGGGFAHDGNTSATNWGKAVSFTPNLPVAGTYRVYMWWRQNTIYANNATVKIKKDGAVVDERTVNQRQNGGSWVLVGTYFFESGQRSTLRLANAGANGYVVADAVRFSLVTPEVIVDNSDTTKVAKTGSWTTLSEPATINGSYLSASGTADSTPTATATYTATLPDKGTYDVYVQWRTPTVVSEQSQAVNGTVSWTEFNEPRSVAFVVDQTDSYAQAGFEWVHVGTFRCDSVAPAPVTAQVTINNASNASKKVTIDAVRFRKVAASEVVIDNADGAPVLGFSDNWLVGDSPGALQYGKNFRYNDRTVSGVKTASFNATLPISGSYSVYLWWRKDSTANTATAAPFTLKTAVERSASGSATAWESG